MNPKSIAIGLAVAVVGGVVTWWITSRFSPAPNQTPSSAPIDLSAGAAGLGQEHAPAPAGFFVDPMTGRLTQGATANEITFHGSGGTVQAERNLPGTRFA